MPVPGPVTTIAFLPISSAGNYVILAKADLSDHVGYGENLRCVLVARENAIEGSPNPGIDQGSTTIQDLGHAVVALTVVHHFTKAGAAELQCGNSPGLTDAYDIKITAIQLGRVTDMTLL